LLDESDKFPLHTLSSKQPFVIHMPAWKGFIFKLTKV